VVVVKAASRDANTLANVLSHINRSRRGVQSSLVLLVSCRGVLSFVNILHLRRCCRVAHVAVLTRSGLFETEMCLGGYHIYVVLSYWVRTTTKLM
jgi:hypothetical protein